MPQAPDELRDKMGEYFGDRICDSGPTKYLLGERWTEKGGFWTAPYDKLSIIPDKEWHCITFLVHEWDHALKHPTEG